MKHSEKEVLVSELHDRRTSVTLLTDALVWDRETRPKFVKLGHEESAMAMAVQEGVAKLDELRQLRSEATVALTRQNQSLRESTARVQASRELTSALEDLARTEHNWRQDQQQVLSTDSEIEGSLAGLKSRNEEERAVLSRLERNTKQQAAIKREIARLEQNSSNLSQLLSRVEDYLDDGACPLCGHDHGSLSDLLRQIGQRRVEDRATDQRVELTRFRGVHEELDQKRRNLRRIVEDDAARVARLQSERADRVERIARFEETATRAGVNLELIHPTQIEEAVARLQATVRKETEEEARRIRFFQDQVEQTRVNMRDLERRIEEADQEVIETQNRLQKLEREIDLLRNDSRTGRVSIDADIATLEELASRHKEQIKSIDSELEEAANAVKKGREVGNAQRYRLATLSSAIDTLRRDIDTQQETIRDARALIIESGFDVDVEEKEIVRQLDAETKAAGRLWELRDFADSVEIAMDTATTAAALEQQRQTIRQKRRRITEVKERIEKHESWYGYFEELTRRVSARQNSAIASFAREYGPMASAIQQRLRSVYGFQGIETGSHEATIRVRVKRGEEILRPTDYFSHSQQQTLLLGLFLTACMSQTWSSLATVLLDDPIIHFDDLNTYAFLDMIVGLLGAGAGPQQFILSTCDHNVFHLARSKFRHLGTEARFYSFSAFGPDGPVVEEI